MGRTLPLTGDTDAWNRTDDAPSPATLLEACTSPQRRTVLETLCEAGPMTIDELADHVAARRNGGSTDEVTEKEHEEVAISLYHNHLQRLSESGIVVQREDGDETIVSLTPTVDPELIRELIGVGESNWTALSAILGDDRRRFATRALARAEGDLTLEELAEAVALQERGDGAGPEFRRSVRISLHHVHLAKLREAGVVHYDEERGLVALDALPEAYDVDVVDDADAVPV